MTVDAKFGYKTAWLAVQNALPESVASGLGLQSLESVPWGEGVEAAYDKGLVILPNVHGWTIAMGNTLLRLDDKLGELIGRLSGSLAVEVQFFLTHRVVELHAWARAEGGNLIRLYRCCGDQGTIGPNLGAPTQIEIDSQIAQSLEEWDAGGVFPDEDTVMTVATSWSLDPTRFDDSLSEKAALLSRSVAIA